MGQLRIGTRITGKRIESVRVTLSVRSKSYRCVINIYIETQCCSLGEDVTDFRFLDLSILADLEDTRINGLKKNPF
jgi:hypothetical protein